MIERENEDMKRCMDIAERYMICKRPEEETYSNLLRYCHDKK